MKPGLLLLFLIPLAAWGVLRDIANTANGGSIDLRNRVTGARIAAAKIDPYSYKWTPGSPEEFCDLRNEPGSLLSKTTVTPWVLSAHTLFNSINYRSTQWLWFFFQYGALAVAVLAWTSRQSGDTSKWGILITLIFSLTPSWRLHVDHGQIYVVFAAVFPGLYWLDHCRATRGRAIAEGLAGAFLIGARPIFLGQFAPVVKARRWLSLISAGGGMLLVVVVPVVLFGPSIWNHYLEAMKVHSEIYLLQMRPGSVPIRYPESIEGIPIDTLAGFSRQIPFADTSIFRNISFLLPPRGLLLLWGFLMTGFFIHLILRKVPSIRIWWGAAAWILIGDFLLPAYRNPYNDILALPLFLFGISALENHFLQKTWIWISILSLSLMILSWKVPPSWKWYFPLPSLTLGILAIASTVIIFELSRRETTR